MGSPATASMQDPAAPTGLDPGNPSSPDHPLLRLVVAGSVDDGKSTLVGRLLFETQSILADQYDAIELASRRRGAQEVDLALLTDGLRAEREQGITIDVAYRYFSTPRRTFILADTPGHTQYTRNTVTGASTADAALLLVDARAGVLPQTRRHAALMAMLAVPHLVVAVNKMDTIDWDRSRFEQVAADIAAMAAAVGVDGVTVVPVSALTGQHVVDRPAGSAGNDPRGAWYDGPSLLEVVESLEPSTEVRAAPFRLPVQLVIRPRTAEHPDYRGLAGRVASGSVAVGDRVVAEPEGSTSIVVGLDTPTGPVERVGAGDTVTVLLADDLDIGRGQVLVAAGEPPPLRARELDGVVCWLDPRPATPRQRVLVKVGTAVVRGMLAPARAHWDVDEQRWRTDDTPPALNDIVRVTIALSDQVAYDPYRVDRATGGFLVIDPAGGATLAAGMAGEPAGAR